MTSCALPSSTLAGELGNGEISRKARQRDSGKFTIAGIWMIFRTGVYRRRGGMSDTDGVLRRWKDILYAYNHQERSGLYAMWLFIRR